MEWIRFDIECVLEFLSSLFNPYSFSFADDGGAFDVVEFAELRYGGVVTDGYLAECVAFLDGVVFFA